MRVNKTAIQLRLGVKPDGQFGPVSYTALLSLVAGRTVQQAIGKSFADHCAAYGLEDAPQRLAAFIGQTAHESGGYTYARELWGPTAAQSRYDAPGNQLGNNPGEGYRYRGAGWIQVTGRHWFDVIGHSLQLDLLGNPDLTGTADVATLISLEWWRMNGINAVADTGDTAKVSRLVNGGANGLAQRIALTAKAMQVLK